MKIKSRKFLLVCLLTLGLPGVSIFAEEQIYGSELMTKQERMEHSTKMQNMKTKEERERYRMEHHKAMQERAKERGVTMPDSPQMRNGMDGGGMDGGSGGGMGGGSGGGGGGGGGGR